MVGRPPGPSGSRPSRRRRWAAYVGAIGSGLGVVGGLVGAGTFLPYRSLMGASYSGLAEAMTAVSVAGLAASALGLWAAAGLLRRRAWAARGLTAAGVSTLGLLALMGALYPVGLFLLAFATPIWLVALVLLWTGRPGPAPGPLSSRAI